MGGQENSQSKSYSPTESKKEINPDSKEKNESKRPTNFERLKEKVKSMHTNIDMNKLKNINWGEMRKVILSLLF